MIQNFASSTGPHISIGPEVLWHIGPLPITNANVLGIIGSALVAWLLISTARKAANGKKMNRLQSMTMMVFEMLYKTAVDVIGDRDIARKVMPFGATIVFFFVIFYKHCKSQKY